MPLDIDIKTKLIEYEPEISELLNDAKFMRGLQDMDFFYGVPTENLNINIDMISSFCLNNDKKYHLLVQALLHTNHDNLALRLDPSVIDMCDLSRCDPSEPYRQHFSFLKKDGDIRGGYDVNEKCELEWKDKSNSITLSELYVLNKSPQGFCLLINNWFTKGTYKEMQKFRNIFYQLNFDVIMEKNLTAKQILDKLTNISMDERLENHSAFVFMIITHGGANRQIYGFDSRPVHIDSILSILKNKNCKALAGKPKLFFINACRADQLNRVDVGVETFKSLAKTSNEPIVKHVTSGEIDYLICFSTLQGHVSIVSRTAGTRFGAVLSQAFINRAYYKDLETIIKRVLNELNTEAPDRPTDEEINLMVKYSRNISQTLESLLPYSIQVFSIENALPKHVFFNLIPKRSFIA